MPAPSRSLVRAFTAAFGLRPQPLPGDAPVREAPCGQSCWVPLPALPPEVLRDGDLVLLPLTQHDCALEQELSKDEDVLRWTTLPVDLTQQQAQERLARAERGRAEGAVARVVVQRAGQPGCWPNGCQDDACSTSLMRPPQCAYSGPGGLRPCGRATPHRQGRRHRVAAVAVVELDRQLTGRGPQTTRTPTGCSTVSSSDSGCGAPPAALTPRGQVSAVGRPPCGTVGPHDGAVITF